jgi:hypothetical protein
MSEKSITWQQAGRFRRAKNEPSARRSFAGAAVVIKFLSRVTLYGKTKIAIDGKNAHILDDEGKDEKVPIAEKIARTSQPAASQ